MESKKEHEPSAQENVWLSKTERKTESNREDKKESKKGSQSEMQKLNGNKR